MNKLSKIAITFAALASLTSYAQAQSNLGGQTQPMRGGSGFGVQPLELADLNQSGDVTFDEFKKAAGERFTSADADKDGKVTVQEMATAVEKIRAEQMAKRIIKRFDVDGDGSITLNEVETNQQELYAVLDRNNDGKLVAEEMQRRTKGDRGGKRPPKG